MTAEPAIKDIISHVELVFHSGWHALVFVGLSSLFAGEGLFDFYHGGHRGR